MGASYGRLWNGWAALWQTEAESLCHGMILTLYGVENSVDAARWVLWMV